MSDEINQTVQPALALMNCCASLEAENIALRSMCAAAAAEIEDHWEAHCDDEGYGPANLMYRLKGQSPPNIYTHFAANMRCVDALELIEEAIVDADGPAEDTVARIREIIWHNAKVEARGE
jgi:hypothetical protein